MNPRRVLQQWSVQCASDNTLARALAHSCGTTEGVWGVGSERERVFSDFNTQSTAQGHLRTKVRDRQRQAEADRQRPRVAKTEGQTEARR